MNTSLLYTVEPTSISLQEVWVLSDSKGTYENDILVDLKL